MKNNNRHNNKSGFTIIELMFAIVVLGGMLALVMTVIVGMLRFYVFANSVRQNQANGRDTLDSITKDLRFGKLINPPSTTYAATNEVCIYDKTNKRVISYVKTNYDIDKKIYGYTSNIDPADCSVSTGGALNGITSTSKKLNLNRMYITKFEITRTQGASFEVNKKAAAIIINYEFLTGAANSSGAACDDANIFCSKLGYQTAINLRGGD